VQRQRGLDSLPIEGVNGDSQIRLIALVQYQNGIMMIRFFGTHEEYAKVDAETV
jgi:mRNA-degrading endonuclease HigB of HigAB toxin-antitoxin module